MFQDLWPGRQARPPCGRADSGAVAAAAQVLGPGPGWPAVAAAHGPVLVALLALYSDSAAWVCADEENVIGTFSLLVL